MGFEFCRAGSAKILLCGHLELIRGAWIGETRIRVRAKWRSGSPLFLLKVRRRFELIHFYNESFLLEISAGRTRRGSGRRLLHFFIRFLSAPKLQIIRIF